jgi:CDP-diacylglycerol--serine O-phosphatidyltransferase
LSEVPRRRRQGFRLAPPDGSRDRRTEDPTNLWFVHLTGRLLLPLALRWRISANGLSLAGLALGTAAALAYTQWPDWKMATLGFALCAAWLIADGMDGMVARATGTTSAIGRFLDGVCDHSVFILLYVALAWSIGTPGAWALAAAAGVAHAAQATLYEGERTRFHRRVRGDAGLDRPPPPRNRVVRAYDAIAGSLDRMADPYDRLLGKVDDPKRLGEEYGHRAAPTLRLMALLSNNVRVIAIYVACLAGDPRLFWWLELGPLSAIAATGIWRHRRIETRLVREMAH